MQVKHFICTAKDDSIVLTPFQSKEEFLMDLEEAEKDWKRNGGLSVEEMRKKHNIK